MMAMMSFMNRSYRLLSVGVIRAFPMGGEVQALNLMFAVYAQAHNHTGEFGDRESSDRRPDDGRADPFHLNQKLAAHSVMQRRTAQPDAGEERQGQRPQRSADPVNAQHVERVVHH